MTRFINDDCLNFMKCMPDKCVDLILTDPPYNISQYSTGNIILPGREAVNNDIADWDKIPLEPRKILEDFKRNLKPDGNIIVFKRYNLMMFLIRNLILFSFLFGIKQIQCPKYIKTVFLTAVK